ncbi:MAG: L,D-transpeptidase [Chthoniobacterales bacterium]
MEPEVSNADFQKRQPGFTDSPCELFIFPLRQTLEFRKNGETIHTYTISTSRFGLGSEEGSFKTPTGNFVIAEKFGNGAPLFASFKSRLFTGEIAAPGGEEDLILTRILWLNGVDENNANTYSRYVYIHGTNQEHLLGTPASHGCIRMRNQDIAELYDQIPEGTPVKIETV